MFAVKYCLSGPINLDNWRGSLKNNFKFSDLSFTHLAAARWQVSMSRCSMGNWGHEHRRLMRTLGRA